MSDADVTAKNGMVQNPGATEPTERLWVVTVEHEVVVLASDEDSACDCAEEVVQSGDAEQPHVYAEPMRYLPGDWDTDSLPFCADGVDCEDGETIAVLIARGHAPEYKKSRSCDVNDSEGDDK
jgi:hypothetical protein